MAQTHDFGPWFWHKIPLSPDAPRWHWATTDEIEEPFRYSRSLVVRLWGEHGLVLGRWRHADRGEEEALKAALDVREMETDPEEIEDWDGPERV